MQPRTKCWYVFTGLLSLLFCVVAVGGLLVGAQEASAQDNGPTVTGHSLHAEDLRHAR